MKLLTSSLWNPKSFTVNKWSENISLPFETRGKNGNTLGEYISYL
jgi:hypothetical protein